MRRHGIPFPGHVVPFGALVDYIPQPDATKHMDPLEVKAIGGIFVGYHILPGGIFAGDYLVATLEDLSGNINAGGRQVKVHRVKEVFPRPGKPEYPIAVYRKRWQDKERDQGVPGATSADEPVDQPPPLVDSSDEGEPQGEVASSSNRPAAQAPVATGPVPAARDTRGEGDLQQGGVERGDTRAQRAHQRFHRSCGHATPQMRKCKL